MRLFKRKSRLVIGTIEVVGLRYTFSVERTGTTVPNKAEIVVYNLTPDHRNELQTASSLPVQLDAGYDAGYGTIFLGKLSAGVSVREDASIGTPLSAADGAKEIRSSRVAQSFPKGTSNDQILESVARAIGVGEGNLSSAVAKLRSSGLSRRFPVGTVLYGSAAKEMTNICRSLELTWSVQNEKLQILPLGKALDGQAIVASYDTGMIEAPSVDNTGVLTLKMLIQPDIIPGRKLVLRGEFLQGQYKIDAVNHTGDTHGNDWYCEIKAKKY